MRGIIFTGENVLKILRGEKTQTRRIIKPQPELDGKFYWCWGDAMSGFKEVGQFAKHLAMSCPYGKPGDMLWVREAFIYEPATYCYEASVSIPAVPASVVYRADAQDPRGGQWKSPLFMRKEYSRLTLEITDVRVQRLNEISEEDAGEEGFKGWYQPMHPDLGSTDGRTPVEEFAQKWNVINGAGSWESKPWVWALTFRKIDKELKADSSNTPVS